MCFLMVFIWQTVLDTLLQVSFRFDFFLFGIFLWTLELGLRLALWQLELGLIRDYLLWHKFWFFRLLRSLLLWFFTILLKQVKSVELWVIGFALWF